MSAESVDIAFLSSPHNQHYSRLEALLSGTDPDPLPSAIKAGVEDHALRWKSGAPLSEAARRRFVMGLLLEGEAHEDTLVRRTRPFLKDLDCYKLCRTLINAAGDDPELDWPRYILAIVGSPFQIERMGRELDDMAAEDEDDAMVCVEILRRSASPEALRWLSHWSQNSTHPTISSTCRATLREMADAQHTAPSEMLEALLPELYFDTSNERRFDYGKRTIVARLRSDLKVTFREESTGRGYNAVPTVRRDDDAEMANAARTAMREMTRDIKVCAEQQTTAMVSAMSHGRRWPLAMWRRRFLAHPVMRALSAPLVFVLHRKDGESVPFSLVGHGELRDMEDQVIVPMPEDSVGILHPVHLTTQATADWRARLAVRAPEAPPFEQLDRRVFSPSMFRPLWEDPIARTPKANRLEMRRRARSAGYSGTLRSDRERSVLTRVIGPWHIGLAFEGSDLNSPILPDPVHCAEIEVTRHSMRVPFERIPAEIFSEVLRDLHGLLET